MKAGYIGVTRSKRPLKRPWEARVALGGEHKLIGRYGTAREAAIARDRAVLHYHLDTPLQVSSVSARLGAADIATLRAETKTAWKTTTATTYTGVYETKRGLFYARLPRRPPIYLGTFATALEAAEMVDRAALHLGLPIRNLPERALRPLTEKKFLAVTARRRTKREGQITGVCMSSNPSLPRPWMARFTVRKGQTVFLGRYETERAAGIACDRAALYYGGRAGVNARPGQHLRPLNFPEESRRLGAASARTLREEQREIYTATLTSKYRGVTTARQGFHAHFHDATRSMHFLGYYLDEKDAARAVDRASLFLRGRKGARNFPRADLTPASPEELRREARRRWKLKTASQYQGVGVYEDRWRAIISENRQNHSLGLFDTQEEAALAYDAAARALGRSRGSLNFPDRDTPPKLPKELACEARRRFKETTTSEYTGVQWDRRAGEWVALIQVEGRSYYLGQFAKEVDAARAYDRQALRLRGRDPRWDRFLNFPDEAPLLQRRSR